MGNHREEVNPSGDEGSSVLAHDRVPPFLVMVDALRLSTLRELPVDMMDALRLSTLRELPVDLVDALRLSTLRELPVDLVDALRLSTLRVLVGWIRSTATHPPPL